MRGLASVCWSLVRFRPQKAHDSGHDHGVLKKAAIGRAMNRPPRWELQEGGRGSSFQRPSTEQSSRHPAAALEPLDEPKLGNLKII